MEEKNKTEKENKISSIKKFFKSSKRNMNSQKKFNTIESMHLPEAYPKNANEFRHILEDIKCCHADVEFMLELRRHKKIQDLEKIHGNEPSFYQEDFKKYKNKSLLKSEDRKMLQVNIGNYRYILSDRSKYAINSPTFKYEVKLREPTYLSKIFDKNRVKDKEKNNNTQKKNLSLNLKKLGFNKYS